MSKMTGGVNEEGFYLHVIYGTKDPDDMAEMLGVLSDHKVDATVKSVGEDHVEVIVRPDLDGL